MIGDRLAGVGEEHRVTVFAFGLQSLNGEVLLGDGVGMFSLVRAVESVDLLAQHGALEGTTGLAFLVESQAWW